MATTKTLALVGGAAPVNLRTELDLGSGPHVLQHTGLDAAGESVEANVSVREQPKSMAAPVPGASPIGHIVLPQSSFGLVVDSLYSNSFWVWCAESVVLVVTSSHIQREY